jgi:hypothetical protein
MIAMKKWICFALLTLALPVLADKATLSAPKMTWAGVDYTYAKFIGPTEFAETSTLFPGMLEAWNYLVLSERIKPMEKASGKVVVADIAGMNEHNKAASTSQVVNNPGTYDTISQSHITPEIIARAVRSYKLETKDGLAVVYIVDRFIKLDKKGEGAIYVVAFDAHSREVLASERIVGRAIGYGFRNYWFRIVKDAEKGLKKLR